jgi:hypothetical protein
MHVSHSQACRFTLENTNHGLSDLAKPAPAVRCDAACGRMPATELLPIASRETLEEGRQVVV